MSVVSPNPSGQLLNSHVMEIQETDSMPEVEPEDNLDNNSDEEDDRGADGSSDGSGSEDEDGVRANQLISLTIAAGVMSTRSLHRHADKRHIDADETFVENLIKKADGYFLTIYANIIAGTPNPTTSKVNSVGSSSKCKQKNEFRPCANELEPETCNSARLGEGRTSDRGNSKISTKIPKHIRAPTGNQNSAYSHAKEKPFKCEYCGAGWAYKRERLFPCQKCGKRFAHKWTLTAHQRTHSGERPYACDQCPKRFSSSSGIHNHRRIHAERKNIEGKTNVAVVTP
ncbi:unnamed protein product [Orchesella dallaii]|uniref:C2H2-type domain-containing protein n=1 Tax=Orchesella dallaii TaxID=48710 RepID=A0ABP1PUV3_9HEXA